MPITEHQFTLRFFAIDPDGSREYVTEGTFDSEDAAIERLNNIGSRWIFYPHSEILCDGVTHREFIDWESMMEPAL